MSTRVVAVALPLPVQQAFSYRVPETLPLPERGARVLVPFAGRRVIGVVTGNGEAVERLKDVVDVLDEVPLIAPPLLDLAAWMAEHYLAPPKISKELSRRQEHLPPHVRALSWKAQNRLHLRFGRLLARRLQRNKAKVAIARELCGFVWALLRTQECYPTSTGGAAS